MFIDWTWKFTFPFNSLPTLGMSAKLKVQEDGDSAKLVAASDIQAEDILVRQTSKSFIIPMSLFSFPPIYVIYVYVRVIDVMKNVQYMYCIL